MEYRELGVSGMKVSVLSFGAWQIGDSAYWGPDVQADADAAVGVALDAGVNLFDTAEMYGEGESERALGKALGRRRSEILVASKVLPTHCEPKALRKACEDSLQRLGMDVIDLYQVHWPFDRSGFADVGAEMVRLIDEGKIRAAGVSNFGVEQIEAWMASGPCVSNQLGYNLLFRAIEYEIAPACEKRRLGILAYMPLLQGILAGRWSAIDNIPEKRRRTRHFASTRQGTLHDGPGCEALLLEALERIRGVAEGLGEPMANVSVAWLAAQPGVTSVIIGGRNPEQIRRNLAAVDLRLPADAVSALNEATEPLKAYMGANADMWKSDEDRRIR